MCKAKTQGHEHMRNTNAPDKEHYPCLLRTAVNWCVVCRGLHITLGLPSWDGRGPVHPRPPPAAAHSCMIRASRRPAERLLGCPNHHVQLTHTTPAGRLSAPGRYTPHPCTHICVVGGPRGLLHTNLTPPHLQPDNGWYQQLVAPTLIQPHAAGLTMQPTDNTTR
jgi:hypothetical protein